MRQFEWLKGLFSFSKSEIRGLIVLLTIVITLLVVKFVLYQNMDEYELRAFYSNDTIQAFQPNTFFSDREIDNKSRKVALHSVDPNKASYNDLVAVGVPSRVARTMIKYREKGAGFYSPNDLFKVYGFDSSLYIHISDYLYFSPVKIKPANYPENDYQTYKIEINRSDSVNLEKLPGIGPVLATRIIKYRNILGGYYSPKQLTEVYGITDSLYNTLKDCIETDTSSIIKMNINVLTFEKLEKHPYLSRYQAKAIVSYRRLIGPFTSVDQLITNYLVPEETYNRLLPYLTVN